MKLVKLSEETNSGMMTTPVDALEDAIKHFKTGDYKEYKKVLIIPLQSTSEFYNVSFLQAGMVMSECLALIEVAKTMFLKEMGYL